MDAELKQTVLKIARQAIIDEFNDADTDTNALGIHDLKRGVFVTLHKNNELRGCIGYPLAVMKLGQGLVQAARSAAFKDPRFPPVKKEELPFIKMEVSLLTVPELIKVKKPAEYAEKIEVGRHGLMIEKGMNSGLLLPQVATENNLNSEEFLMMLCQKAGIPSNSWKAEDAKIYSFEADVVSEN